MNIVWHRGDLRTHDHAALTAALSRGPVLGLVVLDPNILDRTSRRRVALFKENVEALRRSYEARGGILAVRYGDPTEELVRLVDALQAVEMVHALASFTPYGVHRDEAATDALREAEVSVRWYDGLYVHSPGTVRTNDGGFYSVYSPFYRRWKSLGSPDPLPSPERILAPELDAGFDPGDIAGQTTDVPLPEPGEDAALDQLERWADEGLPRYAGKRNELDGAGTSGLSTYITLGVLSARTAVARGEAVGGDGADKWIAELAWRDFMADLLFHRPDMLERPFKSRWERLEWSDSEEDFEAWRDGRTGIPAVDAAMRQLKQTGWISGRARMIAAQFLAKNLRVDWRKGEAVFKDWLLDGDTSQNVGNWHWTAGLGVDNAPYFRVMNPVTQGEKHDPDGRWLQRWVPESEGDPSPRDAIADPKESRKAYLEAAKAVGDHDEEVPPRRPRLDLATRSQLLSLDGVGPETADTLLEALARGTIDPIEGLSGVGSGIANAVRSRFDTS